jgi:nicotinate-nucleotide adenylyltransferase
MKTGLFFGSFNPIHIGHLAIAQYFLNESGLDQVMFIVSPQNPFKANEVLIPAEKRLEMVSRSIADNPKLAVSDIEFRLDKPSYTYKTLEALKELYASDELTILMGTDTLEHLHTWKNPEKILAFPILAYQRSKSFTNPYSDQPHIRIMETPLLDISATVIRKMLEENKDIKYLVRDEIIDLLKN